MINQSLDTKVSDTPMSQVSMTKGYWFYFKHNGNEIAMHGSAWSGKETVYYNNHPVSIKRNLLSFTGEHFFNADDVDYKVVFQVVNIWKGQVECRLYANSELIATESVAYNTDKKPVSKTKYFGAVLLCFLGGMLFGYAAAKIITALI